MPVSGAPERWGSHGPAGRAGRDTGVVETAPVGSDGAIAQAGEVRSRAIESLRALAALAVVEGHIFGVSRHYGPGIYATFFSRARLAGGFGVYLFFPLTGFLLFRPFAQRYFGDGRPIRLGRYAANRAVRILPLYYVVLIVYLLAFDHGGSFTTWWRSALMLENFFPQTLNHVDGVVWSLVVEVQFYILLPFLAAGLARLARGSIYRCMGLVLILGALAEVVRLVTVTWVHNADVRWQYSLPSTFVFFTAGLLLALVQVAWAGRRPSWLRGVLLRSDLWCAGGIVLWAIVAYSYNLDILLVPAALLIIGAVSLPLQPGLSTRFLRWKPIAALGVASYSLYLWHFPLVQHIGAASWAPSNYLVLIILLVPLSCVVAGISYAVVEAPFLRLRRSWTANRPSVEPNS
ncbi:MAG: acyltransferase family protein, partial [Acidimicrobiales bacterium]